MPTRTQIETVKRNLRDGRKTGFASTESYIRAGKKLTEWKLTETHWEKFCKANSIVSTSEWRARRCYANRELLEANQKHINKLADAIDLIAAAEEEAHAEAVANTPEGEPAPKRMGRPRTADNTKSATSGYAITLRRALDAASNIIRGGLDVTKYIGGPDEPFEDGRSDMRLVRIDAGDSWVDDMKEPAIDLTKWQDVEPGGLYGHTDAWDVRVTVKKVRIRIECPVSGSYGFTTIIEGEAQKSEAEKWDTRLQRLLADAPEGVTVQRDGNRVTIEMKEPNR